MKLSNQSRLLPAYVLTAWVLLLSASTAAQAGVLEAAVKLRDTFIEFVSTAAAFGDDTEKAYLIDQLRKLNAALFDLEQEKRSIILVIERGTMTDQMLSDFVISVGGKIDRLRNVLREVAPDLRVREREGADEAIKLLQEAVDTRGVVLMDEQLTLQEATNAAEALRAAQIALASSIDRLNK